MHLLSLHTDLIVTSTSTGNVLIYVPSEHVLFFQIYFLLALFRLLLRDDAVELVAVDENLLVVRLDPKLNAAPFSSSLLDVSPN